MRRSNKFIQINQNVIITLLINYIKYFCMYKSSYQLANHSILPLLYKITTHNHTKLSYLLKDPLTNTLSLLTPSSSFLHLLPHLNNIQNISKASLDKIFLQDQQQLKNLIGNIPQNIQIYYRQQVESKINQPQNIIKVKDLVPFTIGQFAYCFLSAKGISQTNTIILVTHVTQNSTKLPVMFPGDTIGISTIANLEKSKNWDIEKYIQTLQKIKYFPNQTLIFPQKIPMKKDLEFGLKLDGKNEILCYKQKLLKEEGDDNLIPTTLIQEKQSNVYLNSSKFGDIFGSRQKLKCFKIMIELHKMFEMD